MKPRLLDLFCGAGGAAMGYHRAGFDVLGVDIEPQPNYPFHLAVNDALQVLRNIRGDKGAPGKSLDSPGFRKIAAIHASPPCQRFTAYRRRGDGVGDGYPDLIAEVRDLLEEIGKPYVIENVRGAPLKEPVQICGTGLGLDVERHRLFESNVPLMGVPCAHGQNAPRFPAATNRKENSRRTVEIGVWRIPLSVQQAAMGIDWMTLDEPSEALPPAYTEHIGLYLLQALRAPETAQEPAHGVREAL